MDVSFSYHTPKAVTDAIRLLSEHGASSRLLAGGQSLIPELRKRLNEKHAIIDLAHVTELDYIKIDGSVILIGAMCRYVTAAESPQLRKQAPYLAQVFGSLASPAIRNRSTIGGNLAQADRRSSTCVACVLLDAQVTVMDSTQTRVIPISDYLQERVSSRSNQLLCQLKIPLPERDMGISFSSFAMHPHEYPLMSIGVKLPHDRQNLFGPRIVIGGATGVPQRVPRLEDLLCHRPAPSEHEINVSLEGISFASDYGPAASYLRRALTVLAVRTIRAASWSKSTNVL